jgi:hypothetical protein
MNSYTYEIQEAFQISTVLDMFLTAHEAIIRFDERLRQHPLREGWMQRMLYAEACACQLAEGDLVHLEDLVLLDGRAYSGFPSIALSSAQQVLRVWREASKADPLTLLRAPRPGEYGPAAPPAAEALSGPDHNAPSQAHLDDWCRVVRETAKFPPLIAAAIVWDAWLLLLPEPLAAWRAPLLAALVLRARAMTPNFLLPIDTGRRFAPYRRHPAHGFATRINGFLEWAHMAAVRAGKELDQLVLAEGLLRRRLEGKQKNSQLPALVDLFMSRPFVNVPLAAKELGISNQAADGMIKQLGSAVREASGRERCRAWTIYGAR